MSGRWDNPSSSRTKYWSRMLLIGAAIVFAAGGLQLLVFVSAHNLGLAASNAISELTLGIMLVWASIFMRKMGKYGESEQAR